MTVAFPSMSSAPSTVYLTVLHRLMKSGRGRGMKGVELYARVRFAVQIGGAEPAGSGAAVWDRPADGGQDAGVCGAARIPAEPAAGASEAGSVYRDH